jgi:uncharacterized membrane protein YphA (DoxX/SURF4 family)
MDFAGSAGASGGTWIAGALAVAAGICLLIGILTPLAAVLAEILTIGMFTSWLPMPQPNPFDSTLSLAFVGVIAVSVALLGPGAFSLDARLFGLREIVIPHRRAPDGPAQGPR